MLLRYTHNARNYVATLKHATRIPTTTIEFQRRKGAKVFKPYSNLMQLEFEVLNQSTGERSEFEMLVETLQVRVSRAVDPAQPAGRMQQPEDRFESLDSAGIGDIEVQFLNFQLQLALTIRTPEGTRRTRRVSRR